jgi:hypothetical protein
MLRQLMQPKMDALKVISLRVASASNTVLKVRGAQNMTISRNMTKTITLATTEMVWLLLDILTPALMAKNTPRTAKQEHSCKQGMSSARVGHRDKKVKTNEPPKQRRLWGVSEQ